MKTTAEKSHSSSIQKKQQQPFLPKVGQPGFVSAAGVQTKLTVNTPGDEFEKEADDTAEQVMRMDAAPGKKETPVIRKKRNTTPTVPVPAPTEREREPEEEGAVQRQEEEEMLQRQAEEEEMVQMQPEEEEMVQMQPEEEEVIQRQEEEEEMVQMQPEEEKAIQRQEEEEEMVQMQPEEEEAIQRQEEEEEMVQMQPEKGEEAIQRAGSGGAAGSRSAPPAVGKVLSTSGTRMEKRTRTDMEGRFGADFSGVRIHTDQQAADSARSISAKAYTFGNHIVFNSGQYAPHTKGGKKLLAHELTHVVQQGGEVRRNAETASPPSPETTPEAPATSTANNATAEAAPAAPPAPTPETTSAESPPPPRSEPSAEEVPVPEAPAAGEAEQAPVIIEPIMPEPPMELSGEEQQRAGQARANTRSNADAATDLPSEAENTATARAGVTEPPQETAARASGALVAELGQQPEPSPEIEEICNRIHEVIEARRPPDEDALLESDPEAAADEAGAQMNSQIESDADQVQGNYEGLEEDPEGTPEQVGESIETPAENVDGPNINAAQATPDAVPEEEVDLDADVEQSQAQMEQAGMTTPAAEVIQDGPVAEARAAHGELEETAETDPAEVLAEQDAALAGARGNMAALQEQALQALQTSRSQTVENTAQQQHSMVGTEEQMRASLGEQAESIFTGAQEQVTTLLEPLSRTAMEMWNAGRDRISTEFEQDLARVQRWIDDRHSGFGGGLVEIWDNLTGYPDWITDAYNRAERNFGDSVCDLIREISIYVNGIILTCEQIIDNADAQIADLFANAPADQAEWAAQEQERFRQRLNGLREQVASTQQNINEGIVEEAASAVQEARQRIHELRQKARGLLGRVADAITAFLEDPLRAIINGLLSLVGIEPSRFWALIARIQQVVADIANDPLGFAENLLAAIGAGFERFFDNFLSHLFQGFIDWLFSGLGAVGVQIPQDLSLSSIITFFLQLMGITWERIRMLLARHIGEENVALLEQAFELISNLIEMGPQGIFEMLREQLDPQAILDTVINMAVEFVRDALITQITARILMMFNPVGAIAQAIEAIYRVLKWIFENAARIFSLVETVVNGMADIIAGNIAGMAAAVETALARLLVPVIDFFMEFAHLGDLPEKIADTIRGLQEWVEGILDRVIGWLADRARSVLAALGIGGDGEAEEGEEGDLEDTEVGKEVTFTADDERHRLFVDTAGEGVELIINSTPIPLDEKLTQLEGELSRVQGDNREEAQNSINDARSLYENVVSKGAEAEQKLQEAEQSDDPVKRREAAAVDAEVEALQDQLKRLMIRIFELFGISALENIKETFPAEFNRIHPTVVSEAEEEINNNEEDYVLLESWGQIRSQLASGGDIKEIHDRPLKTTYTFGSTVTNEQAIPALQDALNQENKSIEISEGDFIARRKGVIHGKRNAEAGAAKETLENYIFNDGIDGLVHTNLKAFFVKSITKAAPHDKFRPVNIVEEATTDGGKRITYTYAGGQQQFTVTMNKDGYPTRTEGRNLNLHDSGRGVTQDATGKVIGASQHSAHLIANMFMGTGFNVQLKGIKTSLNLIATSDQFNRATMLSAENRIKNFVLSFNNGLDVNSFDLEIEVEWANENDSIDIEKIRERIGTLANDDDRRELLEFGDDELCQLILDNLGRTSQPRVINVSYFVVVTLNDGSSRVLEPTPETGPDLLYALT